jgi:hypothetical protein
VFWLAETLLPELARLPLLSAATAAARSAAVAAAAAATPRMA